MPEELQLLDEWQKRLGLQDWFIVLKTNCKQDEILPDADGQVEYVESTKCAEIKILNPDERRSSLRPFDFEEILVHELLHCKLSLFANEEWDGLRSRIAHITVDDLARAFVDAKRSNNDKQV